jgi:hypothetical protein
MEENNLNSSAKYIKKKLLKIVLFNFLSQFNNDETREFEAF